MNNPTLKEFYQTAMTQINYNVRVETAKDRVRRVEMHIIPYIGGVKIQNLTALHLEQWQMKLHKSKGVDQVRRCKFLLKSILNRAIVHEIIKSNPIEAIRPLREPKINQREIYTKEEVKDILKNARGQTRLFILTMLSTGARSGEMIALKFSDIDKRNRVLKIQRSIRKGEIKSTKTGLKRKVNIPIELFNELQELQEQNPNQEYIFPPKNGSHYKESSSFLRRHFKPLLESLNIDYKSMYSLRHTYATLQLQGGQNINYVAKQLGHTDVRTTQTFYIKYLQDEEDARRTDVIFSFNSQ